MSDNPLCKECGWHHPPLGKRAPYFGKGSRATLTPNGLVIDRIKGEVMSYATLRREAIVSATARGHKLARFDRWSTTRGHAVCVNESAPIIGTFPQDTRCLQWVIIDTAPAPNGIDIGGPAVAINCRRT